MKLTVSSWLIELSAGCWLQPLPTRVGSTLCMIYCHWFQGRGKSGAQLKWDAVFEALKEQSEVGISNQQFEAALKLLGDEDFLVLAGQNIRIC